VGQRHDHRAVQAFVVKHRKLIPGSRRLAWAGTLALSGRLLDHQHHLITHRLLSGLEQRLPDRLGSLSNAAAPLATGHGNRQLGALRLSVCRSPASNPGLRFGPADMLRASTVDLSNFDQTRLIPATDTR